MKAFPECLREQCNRRYRIEWLGLARWISQILVTGLQSWLAIPLLTLSLVSCASTHRVLTPVSASVVTAVQSQGENPNEGVLVEVNTQVNHDRPSCPKDYCSADWPLSEELADLEYWDCKARAIAKAERLIKEYRFSPERLAYVLINSPSLRVAHTALLVDNAVVLDNGAICQICDLETFIQEARLEGILPVADLESMVKAVRFSRMGR